MEYNQKTDRKEKNLRDMLHHAGDVYKGRDMLRIRTEGRQIRGIGHQTFMDDMNALGNALLGLGLADKNIAIIGSTSYEWLVSYFAVLCGVGAAVPIDKELQDDEIANIIADSEAACVIFAGEYQDTMQSIAASLPEAICYIDMDLPEAEDDYLGLYGLIEQGKQESRGYEQREIDETSMASLLYTSGTTGKSKGVMLSQKSILAASEGGLSLLEIGKVCLSVLPVHHSFECTHGIVMMIQNGTTICINNSLRYFADNLKLFQPDAVFLVPLFIERLEYMIWKDAREKNREEELRALIAKSNDEMKRGIDNRDEYFRDIKELFGGNLKLLLCGGAPLPARLMRSFREMGIMLVVGYGITECSPLVSVNGNRCYRDGSAGVPIPCCEVKIVDADGNGEGEIWVKGDNVMLGYYKNEQATRQAMKDGWFDTGDIGHFDEEGFLFVTGRKKNLIVLSNGKNVYPEEIEDFIKHRIPYISEIVVYAPLVNGMNEKRLCAEVYLQEEYTAGKEAEEIRAKLEQDIQKVNRQLPAFKSIQQLKIRDSEFAKTTKKSIKRFSI